MRASYEDPYAGLALYAIKLDLGSFLTEKNVKKRYL
jgi:hypothetical protein